MGFVELEAIDKTYVDQASTLSLSRVVAVLLFWWECLLTALDSNQPLSVSLLREPNPDYLLVFELNHLINHFDLTGPDTQGQKFLDHATETPDSTSLTPTRNSDGSVYYCQVQISDEFKIVWNDA